jgi:cytochrome c oxidase assembly factor CtaG
MSVELPPLVLALAACALYALAARRVRVAPLRAACFAAGALLAGCLVAWDPASLSQHMVQHGLLTTVAAPLVVLGEPVTLVLRCAPAHRRAAFYGALARLRPVLAPATGLVLFVIVQWVCHWPALLEAAETRPLLHASLHALLLGSAVVFFLPLLGRQPVPRRVSGGHAALLVLAAISLIDLVTVPYLATGRGEAAAAMLGAMSPLGVLAVVLAWRGLLHEERRMAQAEAKA